MTKPIRAGGHVIGPHGWAIAGEPGPELSSVDSTDPAASDVPPDTDDTPPDQTDPDANDGDGADDGPAEAECLDCGQVVRVRRDGGLYKHTCEVDHDG